MEIDILPNLVWPVSNENLSQARLREGEDEHNSGVILPPLPEGITLEEYLNQPLNLTTDQNGQITLVFPQIKFLKRIVQYKRGTERVTAPLEVVYESDQLPTGLHLLGAIYTLMQTPVELEQLRKIDDEVNPVNPDATYEQLVKHLGYRYRPGTELRFYDLLSGKNFYGLRSETELYRVVPGHYAAAISG